MGQSNPINGGTSFHRPTDFQHYMHRAGITDDLSEGVRMERLVTLFKTLADAARHCSENLQPGDMQQRIGCHEGVTSTVQEMVMFEAAGNRTVGIMQDCLAEMDKLPCSKMNGTSVEFAKCSQIYHEESDRMKTGSAELAGFLHQDDTQKPERRALRMA